MLTNDESLGKDENPVLNDKQVASCRTRPATRAGLVHGLSWIGLAAPTTPWLRATVSNLSAILDTRRCQVAKLEYLLMIARNLEGEVCKPWLAKGARLGSLGCGFIKARPRGVASSSGRSWCASLGLPRNKARRVAHPSYKHESGFPAIHFQGLPASATIITCGRGSIRCLDLSRDVPIVIDRTHRTMSLAGWLIDMETIFRRRATVGSEAVCTISNKGNSLNDMIDAIMEAEVIAYMVQARAIAPVDDYMVEPVEDNDNEVDFAEFRANPEDHPEDPPIFIIVSNNEEEEVEEEEEIEKVWEEHEVIDAEEQEDWEDDPEEILFEDEEWDVFSDMMIE
ncbi:hypothetical protein TIFTF001_032784 [Ficus carica]|uniref:Uncharacterized protein n=1 Tax=Ficus carica TaxID=3494 RepID=A0AA88DZ72_FICCA|nr:hypothetical protein TIFTF001_032784 [Ficus carica]